MRKRTVFFGVLLPEYRPFVCLRDNLLYSFPKPGKSIFDFKGGAQMTENEKVAFGVAQLISKQSELGRLPKKDDFDEVTRSRIKAFLGPWPRALEKAGLKAPKAENPAARKGKKKR